MFELPTLYTDTDIIVISKPSGLLSVPGRGIEKLDSASHRLQSQFEEVHVVHRLDMATSGLMVFARHKPALVHLQQQFQHRQTEKQYEAIVHGRLTPNQGVINLPMRCDWPNRPRQMVCYEHGKKSLTRWQTIGHEGQHSRITLYPTTGRSHQLRIHCLALGHPIIGDPFYGSPSSQDASPRLCLHAKKLRFKHPSSQSIMSFDDPTPF